MAAFEPKISVKSETWRIQATNEQEEKRVEQEFKEAKRKWLIKNVSESGFVSCESCNAITKIGNGQEEIGQGYFEFHHINDNHKDNSTENLAFSCPFCHMPFHIGFHAMEGNGVLIYAPELTQKNISRIVWMTLLSKNKDEDYAETAKSYYQSLVSRATVLQDWFGGDFTSRVAYSLYHAASVDESKLTEDDKQFLEKMQKGFHGLRFLPDIESESIAKASNYWRSLYANEKISVPLISPFY